MVGGLTVIAIVISGIVVLITLGKISRQLDSIINLFKSTDKKLSLGKSKEDLTASQIQRQLHELKQGIKTMKGDIDWKG